MFDFEVDYETMRTMVVGAIRNAHNEVYNCLIAIHDEIDGMNAHWRGIRYQQLVNAFNAIVDPMNQLLKSIEKIANVMEHIAYIYKTANCETIQPEPPNITKTINTISIKEDITTLRFVSTKILTSKSNISGKFGIIRAQIEALTKQVIDSGLIWEGAQYGGAAGLCKTYLSDYKTYMCDAIDSISKQCITIIENATRDIENAEDISIVH